MSNMIEVGCAWCKWNTITIQKEEYIKSINEHDDDAVFGGYVCDPCRDKYDKLNGMNRLLEAVLDAKC